MVLRARVLRARVLRVPPVLPVPLVLRARG
jgi:hypothetical protein